MDFDSPFAAIELAENPDPRCACVLVLDRSGSMAGQKIAALNAGLGLFAEELQNDDLARRRVEVALVPFGPVERTAHFVSANSFTPPTLTAGADTPMGAALEYAVELIAQQKAYYRAGGLATYRPWLVLMTDGEPTDRPVVDRVRPTLLESDANKAFIFFAIGVQGADMGFLGHCPERAWPLIGLHFREFFSGSRHHLPLCPGLKRANSWRSLAPIRGRSRRNLARCRRRRRRP